MCIIRVLEVAYVIWIAINAKNKKINTNTIRIKFNARKSYLALGNCFMKSFKNKQIRTKTFYRPYDSQLNNKLNTQKHRQCIEENSHQETTRTQYFSDDSDGFDANFRIKQQVSKSITVKNNFWKYWVRAADLWGFSTA